MQSPPSQTLIDTYNQYTLTLSNMKAIYSPCCQYPKDGKGGKVLDKVDKVHVDVAHQEHFDPLDDDGFDFDNSRIEQMSYCVSATKHTEPKEHKEHKEHKEPKEHKEHNPTAPTIFIPTKSHDTLFWCMYIMQNGMSKYDVISPIHEYEAANDFKFKTMELLRKTKAAAFKPYGLRLSEVEADLQSKPALTLNCFCAMAVLYGKSVCYIDGRKVYEIDIPESKHVTVIVYNKDTQSYGLGMDAAYGKTWDAVREKTRTYWRMDSLQNPIKPFSAYKLPDLVEICNNLDICTSKVDCDASGKEKEKKKTKAELYYDILKNL